MATISSNVNIRSFSNSKYSIESTQNKNIKILSNNRVSYFPKGPWTKHKREIEIVEADSIFLFELEEEIFLSVREGILKNLSHLDEKKINEIASHLIESLSNLRLNSLRASEIRVMPPYKYSTAYNFNNAEFLGLHIDTHDGIKNSNRANSWSILGINFGNSERYIHFIDLTYETIIQHLYAINSQNINYDLLPMHKIVDAFFQYFPEYPIKRIKVMPGQGLLLKSQNVIHDGRTNWKGNEDIAFLISGDFDVLN